jgi:hypothetical protein
MGLFSVNMLAAGRGGENLEKELATSLNDTVTFKASKFVFLLRIYRRLKLAQQSRS